jgi:putative SOS response-associated peptidase YedK
MCNRRSINTKISDIEYYYSAEYSEKMEGVAEGDGAWEPAYHINGFDHSAAPAITARDPKKIQLLRWGLIPPKTRSIDDAMTIRAQTLMARSEDMYDKYSYQELARAGKRCLIPTTGYFEHRWLDAKGKSKIPYYIFLKGKPMFSIGGLYSKWMDPLTGQNYFTYTVCTTRANELAEMIHNTGKRMPVILPTKEAEQAWLNSKLSEEDVRLLCEPISTSLMDAYTVSRVITTKNGNVPEAIQPYPYQELQQNSLF